MNDIELRIKKYSERLSHLDGPENLRKRKRTLQHLGKLKRKLKEFNLDRESHHDIGSFASLPRKVIKSKLKRFHDDLLECAKKKQLFLAIEKFNAMKSQGLPLDVHSYGNMINVCVRCQNIEKAMNYEEEMISKGITINIVVMTTLLKGYCESGRMDKALQLWNKTICYSNSNKLIGNQNANVPMTPNFRAVSTMLRGCKRTGQVSIAHYIYDSCVKGTNSESVSDNDFITALDYYADIVSQSLDSNLLSAVINQAKSSGNLNLAGFYLSAARCYAITADVSKLNDYLSLASSCFDCNTSMKAPSTFLDHKRNEYQLRHNRMTTYSSSCSAELKDSSSPHTWRYDRMIRLLDMYSRLLYFGVDGMGDLISSNFILKDQSCENIHIAEDNVLSNPKNDILVNREKDSAIDIVDVSNQLVLSLKEKFGLERIAVCFDDEIPSKKAEKLKNRLIKYTNKVCSRIHHEYFDMSTKHLNLDALFASSAIDGSLNMNSSSAVARRRCMEIGSGTGDWIVAEAATVIGRKMDWISIELRCDRVYDIVTNAVFNGLSNIAVFGGDASLILDKHISPQSIDNIFINFPEPPHFSNGIGDSQGSHMLTAEFFRLIYKILCDSSDQSDGDGYRRGTVTVVSDNILYLQSLAAMIAEESAESLSSRNERPMAFRSVPLPSRQVSGLYPITISSPPTKRRKGSDGIAEAVGTMRKYGDVQVLGGHPDIDVGHQTNSSSYFDRLWENGKKTKRWLIYLEKIPTV